MQAQVLKGTKGEITENPSRLSGEVPEAIVFVEEPAGAVGMPKAEGIFAEMRPHMVDVRDLNDDREALYTRRQGE